MADLPEPDELNWFMDTRPDPPLPIPTKQALLHQMDSAVIKHHNSYRRRKNKRGKSITSLLPLL